MFKDHFSVYAADYNRYRPRYPTTLFAWLAERTPARMLAWDCATGSGQAAVGSATFFHSVIATDASEQQIHHAEVHQNVEYRVESAESVSIPTGSTDLVTVAQALHWFDLPRFYSEVQRVLKPGGLIAVWTYNDMRLSPEVDAIIYRFATEILGRYWPSESQHVANGYATLPLPFALLEVPEFSMTAEWTLPTLLGYLNTWSAVQHYREANHHDPLDKLAGILAEQWGAPLDTPRLIRWSLPIKVGCNLSGQGQFAMRQIT